MEYRLRYVGVKDFQTKKELVEFLNSPEVEGTCDITKQYNRHYIVGNIVVKDGKRKPIFAGELKKG